MKFIPGYLVLFILLFSSCNNVNKNSVPDDADPITEGLMIDPGQVDKFRINTAEDYNTILEMLDKKDLNSINVAIKAFNTYADSIKGDSMLIIFNDFLSVMANSYLERNDSLQGRNGIDIPEDEARKIRDNLSSFGIILSTEEGEYYLEPDDEFMLHSFGDKISNAYREFLSNTAKEQTEKFAEDGTILIPSDSLISRILIWEDFISKYPSFISINKANDLYNQYMEGFLVGTDNSGVFDSESKKLKDKSRIAFENFIEKYKGRNSTTIIREYYDLLKSSDFTYSDKVDSFLLEKIFN